MRLSCDRPGIGHDIVRKAGASLCPKSPRANKHFSTTVLPFEKKAATSASDRFQEHSGPFRDGAWSICPTKDPEDRLQ